MISAFGIDHGLISKYSKVYGTNRFAEKEYQEKRAERMKKLTESVTMAEPDRPAWGKVTTRKTAKKPKKKAAA